MRRPPWGHQKIKNQNQKQNQNQIKTKHQKHQNNKTTKSTMALKEDIHIYFEREFRSSDIRTVENVRRCALKRISHDIMEELGIDIADFRQMFGSMDHWFKTGVLDQYEKRYYGDFQVLKQYLCSWKFTLNYNLFFSIMCGWLPGHIAKEIYALSHGPTEHEFILAFREYVPKTFGGKFVPAFATGTQYVSRPILRGLGICYLYLDADQMFPMDDDCDLNLESQVSLPLLNSNLDDPLFVL